MRLEITAVSLGESDEFTVRAAIVNDSFTPVHLSRNAFTGPTPVHVGPGAPPAESVEPTFSQVDEPLTLQPFTLYGRDRTFALSAGQHRFRAEYQPGGAIPPLRLEATIDVGPAPEVG
jgi:hypothetical protein